MKRVTLIVPFNGDVNLFESNLQRFLRLQQTHLEISLRFILVIDNPALLNGDLQSIIKREDFQQLLQHLKVIRPLKKLGQVNALILGMSLSEPGACLLMADDHKEPDELLARMISLHQSNNRSVVGSANVMGFWNRLQRRLYYALLSLSGLKYPSFGFDSVLLEQGATQKLVRCWKGEQFLQRLIIKAAANDYATVSYDKDRVLRKKSGWTKFYKIKYMISGIDESLNFVLYVLFISIVLIGCLIHFCLIAAGISLAGLSFWKFLSSSPYRHYKSASDIVYSIV